MTSKRSFFSWMTGPASSSALTKSHAMQKVVPFTQEEMFDVVADVSKYHEFLPFCVGSTIKSQHGQEEMDAELSIGFKIFHESFTSRVTMSKPELIRTRVVDSPIFKTIDSEWKFTSADEPGECQVDFQVTFTVDSALHANAIRLFFDDVVAAQLKAFIGRADALKKRRASMPEESIAIESSRFTHSNNKENCSNASTSSTPVSAGSMDREDAEAIVARQSGTAFIKRRMSVEDYEELKNVFEKYSVQEEEGKKMYIDGFLSSCHQLSEQFPKLDELFQNPSLAGAVLCSLIASGKKARLTMDEFVVGVYLMTKASTQEKAQCLFHQFETSTFKCGRINQEELTVVMQRRIQSIENTFSTLILDTKNALSKDQEKRSMKFADNDKYADQAEAVQRTLVKVGKEVPSMMDQIFTEANLGQDDSIGEEEWLSAWQMHPELASMMSMDRLLKPSQWSSLDKKEKIEEHVEPETPYSCCE